VKTGAQERLIAARRLRLLGHVLRRDDENESGKTQARAG